jgi:hypothetical protein
MHRGHVGTIRFLLFYLVCYVTFNVQAGKRGTMKRRLAETDGSGGDEGAASSSGPVGAGGPRRGGIRMRMGPDPDDPDEDADPPKSALPKGPLNYYLRDQWTRGELKTRQVQEIAMKAIDQKAENMEQFASIGNWGKNPKNFFRAMKHIVGWPSGTAQLKFIEIPTVKGPNTPHPVLWPHEWFKNMYRDRRELFVKRVRGPAGATRQFWEGMRGSAFLENHPVLTEAMWPRAIPIGMHGDGGSFSKQDSVYVFSFNSLSSDFGPTYDTRMLFTVIRSADFVDTTIDALLGKLAWSLNLCLQGVDEDGAVLAGGFRGVAVQMRGDWEFYVKAMHLPRWDGASEMCPFCRASGSAAVNPLLRFQNTRPDAPWRGTIWTHEARMAYLLAAGLAIPILFATLIGFRLECVMVDTLHTVDQGTGSHIVGNTLWHMAVIRGCLGGTTIATKVAALNTYLVNWYKTAGKGVHRIQGKLTPERLRTSGDWPKLKAKAAATRASIRFCIHLVETFGDLSLPTTTDSRILSLCRLLQRFYVLQDTGGRYFTAAQLEELKKLSLVFGAVYGNLAATSFAARQRLWKFQPKFHLFAHLLEWQVVWAGNPRFFWTYQDEDLVGHLIEVAHGVHVACLATGVLLKWVNAAFGEES